MANPTQVALNNLRIQNPARKRQFTECDTRCYDLAAKFLEDLPICNDDKRELGGLIQQTIEDYLEEVKARDIATY